MNQHPELQCYYCHLDGKDALGHITVHDRRGCKHVCMTHAKWRLTTSWMFGHSPDCPQGAALTGKQVKA